MKAISLEFFLHSTWTGDDYESIEVCVNEDRSIDYVWIAGVCYDDTHTIEMFLKMVSPRAFERMVEKAFSELFSAEPEDTHQAEVELELERKAGA